jgi:hypothetical protein
VNGKELVFRRPGEDSEEDDDTGDNIEQRPMEALGSEGTIIETTEQPQVADVPKITIHEDE